MLRQKSSIRRALSEELHQNEPRRQVSNGKSEQTRNHKTKKGFAGVSPGEAHKVGDNLLSR